MSLVVIVVSQLLVILGLVALYIKACNRVDALSSQLADYWQDRTNWKTLSIQHEKQLGDAERENAKLKQTNDELRSDNEAMIRERQQFFVGQSTRSQEVEALKLAAVNSNPKWTI